jgi:hypothetical protein
MESPMCQTNFMPEWRFAAGSPALQLIANKEVMGMAMAGPAKIEAGMDFLFVVNTGLFSTKFSTSLFPSN